MLRNSHLLASHTRQHHDTNSTQQADARKQNHKDIDGCVSPRRVVAPRGTGRDTYPILLQAEEVFLTGVTTLALISIAGVIGTP